MEFSLLFYTKRDIFSHFRRIFELRIRVSQWESAEVGQPDSRRIPFQESPDIGFGDSCLLRDRPNEGALSGGAAASDAPFSEARMKIFRQLSCEGSIGAG